MMRMGRDLDAKKRMQDRWRRQDEAVRLREQIPRVDSLSIAVSEHGTADALPAVSHVRVVPVESAPALFEIPCSDRDCAGGIYDITQDVLSALQAGKRRFEGTRSCNGKAHDHPCTRELHFLGIARYRSESEDRTAAVAR